MTGLSRRIDQNPRVCAARRTELWNQGTVLGRRYGAQIGPDSLIAISAVPSRCRQDREPVTTGPGPEIGTHHAEPSMAGTRKASGTPTPCGV